jgi:hypothetical protein
MKLHPRVGVLLFVAISAAPLVFAGWYIAQDAGERRTAQNAARCRIVRVLYDGNRNEGRILYRCPTVDGTTTDISLDVDMASLKEELARY